ncbi:hypothetical protein EDD16DRAFT_471924 [Pisolithus croceorrhizus]|nr:hypothetical protein EDD16DRAFT_471924 [Pisolithus croceorrhizus]
MAQRNAISLAGGWWNDATTRSTTPPITETSPENTFIPSTLSPSSPISQHAIHLCHHQSHGFLPPPRRPATPRRPQCTPMLSLWLAWCSCSPLPFPLSPSRFSNRLIALIYFCNLRPSAMPRITISHALMMCPAIVLVLNSLAHTVSLTHLTLVASVATHIVPSPRNPARAESGDHNHARMTITCNVAGSGIGLRCSTGEVPFLYSEISHPHIR